MRGVGVRRACPRPSPAPARAPEPAPPPKFAQYSAPRAPQALRREPRRSLGGGRTGAGRRGGLGRTTSRCARTTGGGGARTPGASDPAGAPRRGRPSAAGPCSTGPRGPSRRAPAGEQAAILRARARSGSGAGVRGRAPPPSACTSGSGGSGGSRRRSGPWPRGPEASLSPGTSAAGVGPPRRN